MLLTPEWPFLLCLKVLKKQISLVWKFDFGKSFFVLRFPYFFFIAVLGMY